LTTDGDTSFDTELTNGEGPGKSYSISDTYGCSCEQIIEICGYGKGHMKFGCSIGVMESFSHPDGPFCEDTIPAFP
jgi:hypothetical protein